MSTKGEWLDEKSATSPSSVQASKTSRSVKPVLLLLGVISLIWLEWLSDRPAALIDLLHSSGPDQLQGYLRAHARKHHPAPHGRQAEDYFLTIPTNGSIRDASRSYTGFSHIAGSVGDLKSAKIVQKQWQHLLGIPAHVNKFYDAGTKQSRRAFERIGSTPSVHIDTYYPLLNWPTGGSSLSLYDQSGEVVYKASLKEVAVAGDRTSVNGSIDVPSFHGYSKASNADLD